MDAAYRELEQENARLRSYLRAIAENGCEHWDRDPAAKTCPETGCADKHYCRSCRAKLWLEEEGSPPP